MKNNEGKQKGREVTAENRFWIRGKNKFIAHIIESRLRSKVSHGQMV